MEAICNLIVIPATIAAITAIAAIGLWWASWQWRLIESVSRNLGKIAYVFLGLFAISFGLAATLALSCW